MIHLTLPDSMHVAEPVLDGDVKVRDHGLLESALARPRMTAFGQDACLTLDEKAAALPHSLCAITLSSTATNGRHWLA